MRRLVRDEEGAIMVSGLFMAVLLVGFLYHVKGVGESVRRAERLQDAADVGAHDAAVTHARAVNHIALTNLGMFAQYTSLASVSWVDTMYASCAEAEIRSQYEWVPAWRAGVRERLVRSMTQASRGADALRDATPGLAATRVARLADELYGPGSLLAVRLIERPLPMARSDLGPLCAWSGVYSPTYVDEAAESLRAYFSPPYPTGVSRWLGPGNGCERIDGVGPQLFEPLNATGTEPFQQRVVAIADGEQPRPGAEGVEVPRRWLGLSATREEISNFAVAQAEYYSAWEVVNELERDTARRMPEQNAFYPHFRARLRRLRVPMELSRYDDAGDEGLSRWIQGDLHRACMGQCSGLERAGHRQNADVLH